MSNDIMAETRDAADRTIRSDASAAAACCSPAAALAASACGRHGAGAGAGRHQRRAPAPPAARRRRTSSSSSATTSARPTSAPTRIGLMGYRTPNIDRIAKEGMMFTDYYAEQSCTAGRVVVHHRPVHAAHRPVKVGMPGATVGLQTEDATIAELLKPLGYATGQFGKNHLGDQQRVPADRPRLRRVLRQPLPPQCRGGAGAAHLSARPGVPASVRPARRAALQGVGRDDPTEQPRWGRVGKQTIEDTGPLTKKRMETIDDETSAAAIDFIDGRPRPASRSSAGSTRPACTSAPMCGEEHRDKPGLTARTEYADGMIEHDGHVGTILKTLDDLGIANNTIVLYTTDNGPHKNSWPDGGMTPFRSEKNTNWEGAFRVPCLIRWPGTDQAGLGLERDRQRARLAADPVAAAGEPDIKDKLLKGHQAGEQDLQGPSRRLQPASLPHRPAGPIARARSSSTSTTTAISSPALRELEVRVRGAARARARCVWAEPFTKLRVPKVFDLRADPYERADITSNTYYDWFMSDASRARSSAPSRSSAEFLATFKEYPAEPAGGELQHRPDRREAAASGWSRRTSDVQRRRPEQSRPASYPTERQPCVLIGPVWPGASSLF